MSKTVEFPLESAVESVRKIPKIKLTAKQRAIAEQLRSDIERSRPEIIAEARRVEEADKILEGHLQKAVEMLKSVRQSLGLTLDQVAAKTGIAKANLSRLEGGQQANVTINTLLRVANALGHDLLLLVVPKTPNKSSRKLVKSNNK